MNIPTGAEICQLPPGNFQARLQIQLITDV